MNDAELIQALEAEFDLETGFIGQLRERNFDEHACARFMALIGSIDFGDVTSLDRKVVSLLWMLPLFLRWRIDDFREIRRDVTELVRVADRVEALLLDPKVLGNP